MQSFLPNHEDCSDKTLIYYEHFQELTYPFHYKCIKQRILEFYEDNINTKEPTKLYTLEYAEDENKLVFKGIVDSSDALDLLKN